MGGIFGHLNGGESGVAAGFWSIAFAFQVLTVFLAMTEGTAGTTLGKLVMGIKILSANGTPPTRSQLWTRVIAKYSGAWLVVLSSIIGVDLLNSVGQLINFVMFFGLFTAISSKRQTLSDMIAKTAVFKSR